VPNKEHKKRAAKLKQEIDGLADDKTSMVQQFEDTHKNNTRTIPPSRMLRMEEKKASVVGSTSSRS
jgi:hypothetical protein